MKTWYRFRPSAWRTILFLAAVAAAPFATAGDALAVSVGCTIYNASSGSSALIYFNGSNTTFEAGEQIAVTLNTSGSPSLTVKLLQWGTTVTSETASSYPSTLVLTIPSTGTYQFQIANTGGIAYTYAFACPPPAPSQPGTAEDHRSGYANTVRSAARSQTDVLEKNLDSRIDAAFDAAAGRDFGGGLPGQGFASLAQSHAQSQAEDDAFLAEGMAASSRSSSLRELARLGAFDTSRLRLNAAADENSDGGDPAKGTEARSDLSGSKPYTLWGHGSFLSLDNDFNQGGEDNRYDGDSWGYTLGFDYNIRPGLIAGVSLGYTESDIDTFYNSGTYKETGWNIAPYVIARPLDGLTLSAVAGLGWGDIDQTQSGAGGDTESGMWFAALRGAYKARPLADTPLDVTGRLSLLAGRKTVDAFTLSDGTAVDRDTANTRRLKPGVEVAYSFDAGNTQLQPFVSADLIYDFTDAVNNDRQAVTLGGGLRIASAGTGLSGTLSMDRQFDRDDYKAYSIGGTIAYAFGLGGGETETQATVAPFASADIHAAGSQLIGGGLRFAGIGGWFDCELNVNHVLFVPEQDDDDDDDGLISGDTRAMLNSKVTF